MACAASRMLPDASFTSRQARLGAASLVRMAFEKSSASSPRAAQAPSTPATTGSRGSSVPITPVEATATRPGSTPSSSAAADCIASAVSTPREPSPTFEQPELATTARRRPSSAWRETITGAPTRALLVKRAAETVASSLDATTPTSSPSGLMPAATPAARNPAGSACGSSSLTCSGASTQRDLKKVTRAPPSPEGRASGSGPARPGRRRPSRGCRSRPARSHGRPQRLHGRGSGWSHARRRCPAGPRPGR